MCEQLQCGDMQLLAIYITEATGAKQQCLCGSYSYIVGMKKIRTCKNTQSHVATSLCLNHLLNQHKIQCKVIKTAPIKCKVFSYKSSHFLLATSKEIKYRPSYGRFYCTGLTDWYGQETGHHKQLALSLGTLVPNSRD